MFYIITAFIFFSVCHHPVLNATPEELQLTYMNKHLNQLPTALSTVKNIKCLYTAYACYIRGHKEVELLVCFQCCHIICLGWCVKFKSPLVLTLVKLHLVGQPFKGEETNINIQLNSQGNVRNMNHMSTN